MIPQLPNGEQEQSVNSALDSAKDNIRKTTDEARSHIPRYTRAINDYQEQTIQAARETAYNYLELQREIINSLPSAWLQFIENAYNIFCNYWMISPSSMTEAYAKMASSFTENTIAATRLVNNMMITNIETTKTSIKQTKDNAKELSRIGVDAAKTFKQISTNFIESEYVIGEPINPPIR
jgi:hypothetical protein